VGQHHLRLLALGQIGDLGDETVEVVQELPIVVDVALVPVTEGPAGEPLAPPVQRPDVEAVAREIGDDLDILLDEFGAPVEQQDDPPLTPWTANSMNCSPSGAPKRMNFTPR
jgi:hypothetical protein